MSYISISTRINDLPQVIAGPILRHTQHDQVSVWLAMRANPGPIRLKVYLNDTVVAASPPTDLMKFGENLYIIVVTATPQTGQYLTAGNVYTYDVFFSDTSTSFSENGSTTTLSSPGILSSPSTVGISAVTYVEKGLLLPSFSLPPDALEKLRLVHASCRKPHGGQYDALPAVSIMIRNQLDQADGRPHQLYFTGDQIYADDVAAALLAMINDAKATFVGNWSEFGTLPDSAYLFTPPSITDTRIANRFHYINHIKLSTGIGTITGTNPEEGDNHLLGLGEYIAMYLLVWSDVLWPDAREDLPNFDSIFSPLDINATEEVWEFVPVGTTPLPVKTIQPTEAYNKFKETTDSIWIFYQGLAEVRRALANVPVYMMWDDHDVTDDWFFTYNWTKNVLGITDQPGQTNNPYGQLVIQNGMTAFNIFQGWGNAPKRYEPFTAGGELLLAARKILSSATEWQTAQNWLNIGALVLPAWGTATTFKDEPGTGLTSPIEYDLTMQFGQYTVLMLDTRSNRFFQNTSEYDKTLGRERPILIREARLTQVLEEAYTVYSEPAKNNQVLLVVSPAPVIGHNIVDLQINGTRALFDRNAVLHEEELVSVAIGSLDEKISALIPPQTLRDRVDLWFDSEAWSGNPLGLQTILQELAKFNRVMVLSGDVHFSYSSVLNYWRSNLRTGVIAQLTASAAKNSTNLPGGLLIKPLSNSTITGPALIYPRIYVGWNSTTTSNGQPHKVLAADVKTLIDIPFVLPDVSIPVIYNHAVLNKPTVLCTNNFGAPQYFLNRNDAPDYSYRYYFCNDPEESRVSMRRNDASESVDPTLSHWERLANEHAILHEDNGRGVVVNADNIAEITFSWLDADKLNLAVQQGFWSAVVEGEADPDEQVTLKPYTLHTLDLTTPQATIRPETYYN